MLKRILWAGGGAGLIAGGVLLIGVMTAGDSMAEGGHGGALLGYASMLVAMSLIFFAIKRQRDIAQGGVIKFLPAFGMGLAISVVAAFIYAIGWEIALNISGMEFGASYADATIEKARADGMSGEELANLEERMRSMGDQYDNSLAYRFSITMLEIFPVGALVALISALLLRNRRFLAHSPTV